MVVTNYGYISYHTPRIKYQERIFQAQIKQLQYKRNILRREGFHEMVSILHKNQYIANTTMPKQPTYQTQRQNKQGQTKDRTKTCQH